MTICTHSQNAQDHRLAAVFSAFGSSAVATVSAATATVSPATTARGVPYGYRDATRRLLMTTVARDAHRRPNHRRLVLASMAGAGVIVIGGGTALAYQLIGSAPVTDKHSARCYTAASKDFSSHFPGTTLSAVGTAGDSGSAYADPGEVRAPIGLCAYMWSTGVLRTRDASSATPSEPGSYPVPHLVGCVLPSGIAAVFPGPAGTCQTLGLPTASPG
jgi:hypothetical protein